MNHTKSSQYSAVYPIINLKYRHTIKPLILFNIIMYYTM